MELNQDNAFEILNNAKKTLEEKAIPTQNLGLGYDEELDRVVVVEIKDKRHKHLFN